MGISLKDLEDLACYFDKEAKRHKIKKPLSTCNKTEIYYSGYVEAMDYASFGLRRLIKAHRKRKETQ